MSPGDRKWELGLVIRVALRFNSIKGQYAGVNRRTSFDRPPRGLISQDCVTVFTEESPLVALFDPLGALCIPFACLSELFTESLIRHIPSILRICKAIPNGRDGLSWKSVKSGPGCTEDESKLAGVWGNRMTHRSETFWTSEHSFPCGRCGLIRPAPYVRYRFQRCPRGIHRLKSLYIERWFYTTDMCAEAGEKGTGMRVRELRTPGRRFELLSWCGAIDTGRLDGVTYNRPSLGDGKGVCLHRICCSHCL